MSVADRDLSKLQPEFRNQVELFLEEATDVFVTEAFRTAERQNELFKQGKSYIDGYSNLSMHQRGLAIDVAFRGDELYPKDHGKWEKMARIANKYGMDWGYDLWSHTGFIDKPHLQDNSEPFVMPPSIPEWAEEYVEKMDEKGITTPPTTKVGELPLYQLVGIIDKYIS